MAVAGRQRCTGGLGGERHCPPSAERDEVGGPAQRSAHAIGYRLGIERGEHGGTAGDDGEDYGGDCPYPAPTRTTTAATATSTAATTTTTIG